MPLRLLGKLLIGTMTTTINNVSSEKPYYIGLSMIPGIGARTLKRLVEFFGTAQKAWECTSSQLRDLGYSENVVKTITDFRVTIDLKKEYDSLSKNNIRTLIITESNYPTLLKEIYDAPPILYMQGDFQEWNDSLFLAVVGTRKLSGYGKEVIKTLIPLLIASGFVIVSGLAKGGDTVAHDSCLAAGGKTIAVLGSGLYHLYPPENRDLAKKITSNGAIVSEYHPNCEPKKFQFPLRNRLISGLSLGVLVVEASGKSGALITAQTALEQNREVFAVPGSIFNPYSEGPAQLIKMGAKMVTCVQDVLDELKIETKKSSIIAKKVLPPESIEEKRILQVIASSESITFDEIVQKSNLASSVVLSTLSFMEMKGNVVSLGQGKYCQRTI